jgi:hypothetical protein
MSIAARAVPAAAPGPTRGASDVVLRDGRVRRYFRDLDSLARAAIGNRPGG